LIRDEILNTTKIIFQCPISGGPKQYQYLHSVKHRDRNSAKSQWTISKDEETSSFKNTCEASWINGGCGWGIHIVDEKIAYLGYDRDVGDVFLAKFDNHSKDQWHGYPCNYKINNQLPPQQILLSWVEEGILKLSKMRKITRGQRCAI